MHSNEKLHSTLLELLHTHELSLKPYTTKLDNIVLAYQKKACWKQEQRICHFCNVAILS